jgi:hypothetical protein
VGDSLPEKSYSSAIPGAPLTCLATVQSAIERLIQEDDLGPPAALLIRALVAIAMRCADEEAVLDDIVARLRGHYAELKAG